MKSSFEQPSAATIFWKSGVFRVGELARAQALARRRLHHLDAVLVGAGEEIDVVTVEPHEAGDRVGRQRLIGMADMRRRRSDRRSRW